MGWRGVVGSGKARAVLSCSTKWGSTNTARCGRAWSGAGGLGESRPGEVWSGEAREVSIMPARAPMQKPGVVRCGRVRLGTGWLGVAWLGPARQGAYMPKKRTPREVWETNIRPLVWKRDQGRCQGPYCQDQPPFSIPLEVCHIDHIKSGKHGSNALSNLRVLCRRCHVLRADMRHQGMIARALADEIIPPNWRELVWGD